MVLPPNSQHLRQSDPYSHALLLPVLAPLVSPGSSPHTVQPILQGWVLWSQSWLFFGIPHTALRWTHFALAFSAPVIVLSGLVSQEQSSQGMPGNGLQALLFTKDREGTGRSLPP